MFIMNCSVFNPNLPYFNMEQNIRKGIMKINGVGIVKTEPDIAIVNLGVMTQNKNLEVSQKENAEKTTAVINDLLHMNISKKDISTSNYTIEPEYDFVEGKQLFRGYRVTNILNINIRELNNVGEIIDSAVSSGANIVNSIRFTVENPSLYYNKALRLAVKDAILKAKEIGNTLGVSIDETPCKVVEESTTNVFEGTSTLKTFSAVTPIISGELKITAKINAVFNY